MIFNSVQTSHHTARLSSLGRLALSNGCMNFGTRASAATLPRTSAAGCSTRCARDACSRDYSVP